MTLLTKTDIEKGALKRGTAAFDQHFPKLPEQHPPALIPGPPRSVVAASDESAHIPVAPPMEISSPTIVPSPTSLQAPPLAPMMPKSSTAGASSSSPIAEVPLPELPIEKAIERAAQSGKVSADYLNELAIQAARAIRTRDEAQWAPLFTRCTKALAHCARMTSEGQAVTWNAQRGNPDVILTKEIQKVVVARPADNDEGRRHLGNLFGFVIGEQVFNEGNNRGAYFLVSMLSEFSKITLPPQEKFTTRNKDAAGFFKKKIAQQFMDMYKYSRGAK